MKIHDEILEKITRRSKKVNRSVYELENGKQVIFRTSKKHPKGKSTQYFFGIRNDLLTKAEISNLYVFFVCGKDAPERQILIFPAEDLLKFLEDVIIAKDNSWKISFFETNGRFDISLTGKPKSDVTKYLNRFDFFHTEYKITKSDSFQKETIEEESIDALGGEKVDNFKKTNETKTDDLITENLPDMVWQIGKWMDYIPIKNYKMRPDVPYDIDIAWMKNNSIHIAIIFQTSEDVTLIKNKSALAMRFGARKCIIISNQMYFERIKKIFKYENELKHWVEVWRPQYIANMFKDGRKFFEVFYEFDRHQYRNDVLLK